MEELLTLLFIVGFIYLIVWAIKLAIKSATHTPTWKGIIISALLGMLPFYLILCFFGIMGEKRGATFNGQQPYSGTYAEEMNRRYGYDNSPKKKNGCLAIGVFVLFIFCLFYFASYPHSEEQEPTPQTKQKSIENTLSDKTLEETSPKIKENSPVKKQETKRKKSDTKKETPTSPKKESEEIEKPAQSETRISQEKHSETKADIREKTTIELLEEQNHARVVKEAKEAGVSTEGSTIEILERMNHARVVKDAKEAGVSTEGSTIEILERMNHARVVKDAKEAGVSTEGSTIEILERITRKRLEKGL